MGKDGVYVHKSFPDRNVSDKGIPSHETVIRALYGGFKCIIFHYTIKKLTKPSAIQNNSITSLSVIIAIIVRNFYFAPFIKIR